MKRITLAVTLLLVLLLNSCQPEQVSFDKIEVAPHRWDAIKYFLEQKGFPAADPNEKQIRNLEMYFLKLEEGKLYWSYSENKIMLVYISPHEETIGKRDILYYPRTNRSGNLIDEYYQSSNAPHGGWKEYDRNMWGGFKKQVSSTYDSLPMDSKYQSIIQEFEIWFADSEQREDRIYWLRDELNGYMVISNGNKEDCLAFSNHTGSIDALFSLIPDFEYQRATAQDFNGLMYGYLLGLLPGWILVGGDLYTEEVQSFSQDHLQIIHDFGLDNKGYQVTTYHWGKDGAEYRCDSFFSPYQNKRTDVLVGIKK